MCLVVCLPHNLLSPLGCKCIKARISDLCRSVFNPMFLKQRQASIMLRDLQWQILNDVLVNEQG